MRVCTCSILGPHNWISCTNCGSREPMGRFCSSCGRRIGFYVKAKVTKQQQEKQQALATSTSATKEGDSDDDGGDADSDND